MKVRITGNSNEIKLTPFSCRITAHLLTTVNTLLTKLLRLVKAFVYVYSYFK